MIRWASRTNSNLPGFTIVELLIVIIVIAILAVIVSVSYTGIVSGANDSAVKSDLEQIGREMMKRQIESSAYPVFAGNTDGPGFNFGVNRDAYELTGYNLYICQSDSDPQSGFAIAARSKTGNIFAWRTGGFITYSGSWGTSGDICPSIGYATYNFTYGRTNADVWATWTAN